MDFVEFDSFQGLPEPSEIDKAPIFRKGVATMDEPTFRRLCK